MAPLYPGSDTPASRPGAVTPGSRNPTTPGDLPDRGDVVCGPTGSQCPAESIGAKDYLYLIDAALLGLLESTKYTLAPEAIENWACAESSCRGPRSTTDATQQVAW